MTQAEKIIYLQHDEIDLKKWDDCILNAPNGLIYALSDYLNAMAPGWNALVLNDYETVFPLPSRKKFGIHYIYQPVLIAELGLFGKNITTALLHRFLDAIPSEFRYIDLPLNFNNRSDRKEIFTRQNFVLDLDRDYNQIYDGYNKNIKRNILKAERQGCKIIKNAPVRSVTSLAAKHIRDQKGLSDFENLFNSFWEKGEAKAFAVSSEEEIVAAAAFMFSHGRAYYILAGNHEDSKSKGASHFLIDAFIKDHAGSSVLLDFEGSDIPGLAQYYASFGATPEPYYALRWNRLPVFLKWLKK